MKIVVLDGYTLNPGDLSWESLEKFGDLKVYDRTDYDENSITTRILDADIVFTNKTPLNKTVLKQATHLKYIGVLATGYNVVDIEAAKENNITVTNVPAYSTEAVAQFTMALLLEVCHHVGMHNQSVKAGEWTKSLDFSYWKSPLIELKGKTLGIVGFGKIGQATAKIAEAFGLNVLAYNRSKKPELNSETCKYANLDELFKKSDIISLHCPLFESTKGMINSKNISKMKDGVIILNTSRGGLVNERELAEALKSGKVYAAGIDVASTEPIQADNPLIELDNCIITPHIAWAPKEARTRLMNIAVNNLKHYIEGSSINVITS